MVSFGTLSINWQSFDDLWRGGFTPEYLDLTNGNFVDGVAEGLVDSDAQDKPLPNRYMKVLPDPATLPIPNAEELTLEQRVMNYAKVVWNTREERRIWTLIKDRELATEAEKTWNSIESEDRVDYNSENIRAKRMRLKDYRKMIDSAALEADAEPVVIPNELIFLEKTPFPSGPWE